MYQSLYEAVKGRYFEHSGLFCQNKTNELWKDLQSQNKKPDDLAAATSAKIKELKDATACKKSSIKYFFAKVNCSILFFQ